MKTRAAFTFGLSALALGGTLVGVATQYGGSAFASARSESDAERRAAAEAVKGQKALAKGKTGLAIYYAEAAVGLRPQVASFRMLLGMSYLKAGRFDSARQAYADALSLDPSNAKAALNLALTQIATGGWSDARKTLDAHSDTISASDRGLAVALAGDPAAGVEILSNVVRTPTADAKARQNLALAFALAGRWQEAKTMVAIDLAPGEVDQRIMQWASFARPKSAYDQVASLLGVTPTQDAGEPAALALNAPAAVQAPALASTPAAPIDTYMPGTPVNADAVAAEMGTPVPAAATPAPAPVAVAAVPAPAVAPAFSSVVFGPREEVVQTIHVAEVSAPVAVAPRAAASPVAGAEPRAVARGNYFVQFGAYANAGVARDAWGRVTRRDAAFSAHTPSGMSFSSGAGRFYRLSVGGFGRADAVSLCRGYKAKGGDCFVREGAGDQVALWVKSGKQFASR